jgi:hypothetical protein
MGLHRIIVDSDGDVRKMLPIWQEAGVNGVMPFEVKAGNNVEELTSQYPGIVFIGGIDKHEVAKGKKAIDAELDRRLGPILKEGRANYIPSLDHWIDPAISLEDFQYYSQRVLNYHKESNVSVR